MSEQQSVAVAARARNYIAPFEVEIATRNSGDWYTWTLGMKLRGRWSRHNLGPYTASVSRQMSSMPDIPGMRVRVTPKENKVQVYDPLEKDPELLRKVSGVFRSSKFGMGPEFTYVKPSEKVMDDDMFVTFLIELRSAYDKEHPVCELVSGEMPTKEQIASLPGRELNNPNSPYKLPRYKGDEDRHMTLLRAMEEKGIII